MASKKRKKGDFQCISSLGFATELHSEETLIRTASICSAKKRHYSLVFLKTSIILSSDLINWTIVKISDPLPKEYSISEGLNLKIVKGKSDQEYYRVRMVE